MMYSVMLVDNEPIIPKGLMKLIDWRSCDCQISAVARDGIDAVRQIREQAPDILITDIRMPEMDGLQLCAWVREHCPRTQIILLTGFPDFEYAQQAIQYQVAAFVLKPTTEDALTEALNKACRLLEKDGSAAAEQRNLLLEQQLLLGEMIFHNRHSLLYTLTRLNALHIQLDKPDFSNDRFMDSKYVSVPREEELLDHSSSCNIYECRFHDLFLLCR